jgi:hypothetical protein
MSVAKYIAEVLVSLKTALWLLVIMLALMLAGAVIMPGKSEFQALHTTAMMDWIRGQPAGLTWWLWGLIAVLAVMALNTLFCSIESIVMKRKVTQWLLLISPQVIHAGFLLILFAHLLSAIGASQAQAVAGEGTKVLLADGKTVLTVQDIRISFDYYGYIQDWQVDVQYSEEGRVIGKESIRPNDPSTSTGFNINVKDLKAFPREAVLLQIQREPGSPWALAGGVVFMVGIVTLIILRVRMER